MAKKKNQTKKHRFKYAQPDGVLGLQPEVAHVREAAAGKSQALGKATVNGGGLALAGARDFSYVASDLRRIVVFACALVAVEAILWLLFSHTGLGNTVYSWVRV
jgi:hypothetical protein